MLLKFYMSRSLNKDKNLNARNRVYIETFGCQMNVSDSERVATKLQNSGYDIVASEADADVVLLNTCSVRERAEQKLYTRVGEIADPKRVEEKPIIGVLGCVAQLEGETLFDKSTNIDFVVGTRAVGRIDSVIAEIKLKRNRAIDLGERELDYDWSVGENQRKSPYVAFVPIIEGCNKFCTYCIVPFSRGRERSLPADQVIRQINALKEQGIKEIHLIGQNVNSYRPKTESGLEKFKGATPFSRLLRAAAATNIERIKFNTSFPRDFHPDIVSSINEFDNLCNWVHLPVQSGSDRVLKLMRRGHTASDYLKKIEAVKKSPRKIALTTDVIVGFPGENEDDFRETVKLYEECEFDTAYIFKYSPRPGTIAASQPDFVSTEAKRERFLALEKIQKRFLEQSLKDYVGRSIEVLAENYSAKSDDDFTGHTRCHKVVNFEAKTARLGDLVQVRVTESKVNSLRGELDRSERGKDCF